MVQRINSEIGQNELNAMKENRMLRKKLAELEKENSFLIFKIIIKNMD